MKLNELKIHFDAGSLKEAQAIKGLKPNTWMLVIDFEDRKKQSVMFDSQREKSKEFKNLETVINIANKIGFKKITINM